ncbi:MAG: flagellar protein [Lachnospiraceae bacterium]|nr:flagellar protein [Lachnospiraceae bacterium]
MNVRNCKKCGKIFNYISGQPICQDCKKKLEDLFQKVKEYIQENKGASVQMVAEECEVDEGQIRQWVREERLVFSGEGSSGIVCESCGEPITTGRYCEKCKAGLINSLNGAIKKPEAPVIKKKEKESPRMRFLDKN